MFFLGVIVGIGSIVGVVIVISIVGLGVVFWMWVIGFVGMVIKYFEGILVVKYWEKGVFGYNGGFMYYIKNGFNMFKFVMVFVIFMIIVSIGIGNMM